MAEIFSAPHFSLLPAVPPMCFGLGIKKGWICVIAEDPETELQWILFKSPLFLALVVSSAFLCVFRPFEPLHLSDNHNCLPNIENVLVEQEGLCFSINLGIEVEVAAKHRRSNPAHTKGSFVAHSVAEPFTSTFCCAWFMGPLSFSLPPAFPRATALILSWMV